MVLISQVWIQHLPCTQIIGYAYLRVGSDVDPDLACPLYTALEAALTELQEEEKVSDEYVHLSGIHGYRPGKEGLGLLTMQNEEFRIILLCEGFTGKGIPYLTGDALEKIRTLLDHLSTIITEEECKFGHLKENRDESFWWNLVVSHGLGQLQIEDLLTRVFPLRFVRIQFTSEAGEKAYIRTLEDTQRSLGYGFTDLDELITKKIQLIYKRPHETFQLYKSLFQQMAEFRSDMEPTSLLLIFHKGDLSDMTSALVIFLSLTSEEITLQFGVPLVAGLHLDESRDIQSALQGIAPTS